MSQPQFLTRTIGREGHSLIAIDDFAADPETLREAAIAAVFEPGRHHYPGIRAPLPPAYLETQLPIIAEALGRAVEVIDASFSIVTTPPAALSIAQRLPHVDAHGADRFALIHYLSEGSDGTGFYRHRSTGFESVAEALAPIYRGQLEAELRHCGPPPDGYVGEGAPLFERHTLAEARYNRAYLYPGFLLHSGAIAPDSVLSADSVKGRLTVTAFLVVR